MRFVIFGAGAIGGAVGARLHQSAHEVVLIARGEHLEAIQRDGLIFETPVERLVLKLSAVADPADIHWREDDIVLLATKSQDTRDALLALRATAGPRVPVVCLQNGVENERLAARVMRWVYGAVVMLPAAHMEPGRVEAYGARLTGLIDIGGYPDGVDERCRQIAAALHESAFLARAVPDVMRLKYAKLLLNVANAAEALCGPGADSYELIERARAEGRVVLAAARIELEDEEVTGLSERWEQLGVGEIGGRERVGSSTWQSLARGQAIETDYLNGEIVLEGRLHGVDAPVNAALCELAARAARERLAPGSIPVSDVLAAAA